MMQALLFAVATFFSTYLGGLFSIKFREKLHSIMCFTAGVLVGVFSFDILPEIISQVKEYNFSPTGPMIAFAAGFVIFHILEKTILIHHSHEQEYAVHKHPKVGVLSALALVGHSFVDGVGIGLGFQINAAVGVLVAVAVLSHDFTDGMNTVSLMLVHKNTVKKAKWFLFLDALAPVLGACSTLFFTASPYFLLLYLGFFGGFLMYIGASDILPEAHSKHSSLKMVGLTVLGMLFVFVVARFV
ncbi:MAG: ZIP family metal transporter [Patescibacteria group bacterium]|nr:ZIP family metal transporter [Patescibacteria group bacterium]